MQIVELAPKRSSRVLIIVGNGFVALFFGLMLFAAVRSKNWAATLVVGAAEAGLVALLVRAARGLGDQKPRLRLDDEGILIQDLGKIPWRAIQAARTERIRLVLSLVKVSVDDSGPWLASEPKLSKVLQNSRKFFGAPLLDIYTVTLGISGRELLELMKQRWGQGPTGEGLPTLWPER